MEMLKCCFIFTVTIIATLSTSADGQHHLGHYLTEAYDNFPKYHGPDSSLEYSPTGSHEGNEFLVPRYPQYWDADGNWNPGRSAGNFKYHGEGKFNSLEGPFNDGNEPDILKEYIWKNFLRCSLECSDKNKWIGFKLSTAECTCFVK